MSEATIWDSKIKSANTYYKKWADKYVCSVLEDYRRGFQYKDMANMAQRPYVVNLVDSTIDIKLSSYSFSNLRYSLTPKPGKMDYDIEYAVSSAILKQDALNTIVEGAEEFQTEIEQAIVDSFFRFGLLEVGYSADWITNPNSGKPLFATDVDPLGKEDEVLREPDLIPEGEKVFFKQINSARFRVGGIEGRYLKQANWFGYYDYYYADDLKASPALKNTTDIKTMSHRIEEDDLSHFSEEMRSAASSGDLIKVWKIWDNRSKTQILWDEVNDLVLYEKSFKRIPILDIRWKLDSTGFYPIPPVFQWISPQDEINESRQQMRSYRKRFVSQYQVMEGMVAEEEKDKFTEAKDGTLVEVRRENAIQPINQPGLPNVIPQAMIVGKDDFVLMSGTSSENMGVADRMTATQSMEVSKRFQVRESREQIKIATWLVNIGREALAIAREKLSMGFWVKTSIDSQESILGELKATTGIYQQITAAQLDDGIDYDVNVQITSMSPIANDAEKRCFLEFLAIVTQFPQISLSPAMIREAAYRVGYRNEKVIREMQATAMLSMMGQAAGMMQGQQQGQTGNQTAQQITANQTPNDMEQIRQQMDGQMTPS